MNKEVCYCFIDGRDRSDQIKETRAGERVVGSSDADAGRCTAGLSQFLLKGKACLGDVYLASHLSRFGGAIGYLALASVMGMDLRLHNWSCEAAGLYHVMFLKMSAYRSYHSTSHSRDVAIILFVWCSLEAMHSCAA